MSGTAGFQKELSSSRTLPTTKITGQSIQAFFSLLSVHEKLTPPDVRGDGMEVGGIKIWFKIVDLSGGRGGAQVLVTRFPSIPKQICQKPQTIIITTKPQWQWMKTHNKFQTHRARVEQYDI
jgi:hypothetical protein